MLHIVWCTVLGHTVGSKKCVPTGWVQSPIQTTNRSLQGAEICSQDGDGMSSLLGCILWLMDGSSAMKAHEYAADRVERWLDSGCDRRLASAACATWAGNLLKLQCPFKMVRISCAQTYRW